MIWIFVRRDYGALECADVAGRSALFKARWQCNLAAGERMLEEETQHFPRCVRSSRISVGADGAASRPCVSSSVDIPVLQDSAPTRVAMDSAGIVGRALKAASSDLRRGRHSRRPQVPLDPPGYSGLRGEGSIPVPLPPALIPLARFLHQ
jgi:hypothetical protein